MGKIFPSKWLIIPIIPFVVFMCLTGCAFGYDGKVTFYNEAGKKLCTFKVEFAVNELEQARGLMFRKSLPRGYGMLFIHKDDDIRAYWMKNTYIPLDMIFIDSKLKVVDIYKNAVPLDEKTIYSKEKARYVLEINSGESDLCNIKKGVMVNIMGKKLTE